MFDCCCFFTILGGIKLAVSLDASLSFGKVYTETVNGDAFDLSEGEVCMQDLVSVPVW